MPAALALVAAVHLGFQATVTAVVYPALAEVPDTGWAEAHRRHSNRISLLVVPLYLGVAAVCVLTLVQGPRDPATGVALGAEGLVLLITAALAAPTHGRLGATTGSRQELLRRLRVIDLARLLGAAVGTVAATVALVQG
jgi:hypothetical protein